MIRILVFSDTHSNTENIKKIIRTIPDVSYIIHLGDYVSDIKKIIAAYPNFQYYYVAGNGDYFEKVTEQTMVIEGFKFFITHGHKYQVKSNLDTLFYKAKESECDVCLFGHTHFSYKNEMENIVFINPGSLTFGANGSSYAIIEIENGKLSYDILRRI